MIVPTSITQHFSVGITAGLEAPVWVRGLEKLAEGSGAEVSHIKVGPYPFESLPPKGSLEFDLTGASNSLEQASSGLDALVKQLNTAASLVYRATA